MDEYNNENLTNLRGQNIQQSKFRIRPKTERLTILLLRNKYLVILSRFIISIIIRKLAFYIII